MVHLPFADRVEAGRLLAAELARRHLDADAIVLALTRGGVPVGFEVAERLHLPLDLIVVRKIGVPWQPELAMGALAGTVRILDDRTIGGLGVPETDVDDIVAREQAEMKRREELYRAGMPPLDLHGRSAVLIDDGLATGNTMLAAIRYVRTLNPAKVIVGVPVGSGEACRLVRGEADDLVCLAVPEYFYAVGEWYRDFQQVGDAEVRKLMAQSHSRTEKRMTSGNVV